MEKYSLYTTIYLEHQPYMILIKETLHFIEEPNYGLWLTVVPRGYFSMLGFEGSFCGKMT